jgi:hypothetical protein
MKLTVLMPEVRSCGVAGCGYNADASCHARGITIGDGQNPGCDTYMSAERHTRDVTRAGVGACKATSCRHNLDYECQAEAIRVEMRAGEPECVTYEPADAAPRVTDEYGPSYL